MHTLVLSSTIGALTLAMVATHRGNCLSFITDVVVIHVFPLIDSLAGQLALVFILYQMAN